MKSKQIATPSAHAKSPNTLAEAPSEGATRRSFIKSSALMAFAACNLSALGLDSSMSKGASGAGAATKAGGEADKKIGEKASENLAVSFFIHDETCTRGVDLSRIKADKIIVLKGDISPIDKSYSEIKQAFARAAQNGAIIGSISSAESFFVLSRMGADYGLRVAYQKEVGDALEWILAPKGVRI